MASYRYVHNRGFTLFELLVTVIVLGVAAVPLSLMVVEHAESLAVSREHAQAGNLLRDEMENVRSIDYAQVVTVQFPQYKGYAYDLNRAVSYVAGSSSSQESLKKITVAAAKAGSTGVIMRLTTYRAKNVY